MMLKKFSSNPFIFFSPFLIIYLLLVFRFPTPADFGDQARYLTYAQYMINGFLPLNEEFELLGNGPGYSIILIPFVFFKLPLLSITILNAILYYISIIFLFKSLRAFTTFKKSIIYCLFWGFYYNLYEHIIIVSPEILVSFLIILLIYFISKTFSNKTGKNTTINIIFSGFILGFIALIKPIFGYVLLTSYLFTIILFLFKTKSSSYKNLFIVLTIALITTIPYLIFTYNHSGKLFYWSSLGGNNLYWMTTPFENEYGDWFRDVNRVANYSRSSKLIPGGADSLINNHQDNFNYILKYDGVERDEAYKKIAISNIRNYPDKYLKNIFANAGRIVFNFPYSYASQKTTSLLRLPLNGIILVISLFSLLITFFNWKKLLFSIKFLLFFILIYLGGSLLASAETRMFSIIVPVLLYWIAFTYEKSIRLNLKW